MITLGSALVIGALCSLGVIGMVKDFKVRKKK